MTYSSLHLKSTTQLILNQCHYRSSGAPLNREDKKQAATTLLTILNMLQQTNPHKIVISANDTRFEAFFAFLSEADIHFPDETDYILKREGITYKRYQGVKTRIFDRQKVKHKKVLAKTNNTLSDLNEQLNCLSLSEDDPDSSEQDQTYTPLRNVYTVSLDTFMKLRQAEKKERKQSFSL